MQIIFYKTTKRLLHYNNFLKQLKKARQVSTEERVEEFVIDFWFQLVLKFSSFILYLIWYFCQCIIKHFWIFQDYWMEMRWNLLNNFGFTESTSYMKIIYYQLLNFMMNTLAQRILTTLNEKRLRRGISCIYEASVIFKHLKEKG